MGQRLTHLLFGSAGEQHIEAAGDPVASTAHGPSKGAKRQRARQDVEDMDIVRVTDAHGASAAASFLGTSTLRGGFIQTVCCGARVEATYGAPYHLYNTLDIAAAHGVALGWDFREEALTAPALLRLARVANAAKKSLVLVIDDDIQVQGADRAGAPKPTTTRALELTYSASL
jgi:hypothetical protein